jgi:hypothetical protein
MRGWHQEEIAAACDPYCPERHYMRGPGPKWFAKHEVIRRLKFGAKMGGVIRSILACGQIDANEP